MNRALGRRSVSFLCVWVKTALLYLFHKVFSDSKGQRSCNSGHLDGNTWSWYVVEKMCSTCVISHYRS